MLIGKKQQKPVSISKEHEAEYRVENQETEFAKYIGTKEEYEVPEEVTRCYFFNPFSVELLRKVIARIVDSFYAVPREILLFFYFMDDTEGGILLISA